MYGFSELLLKATPLCLIAIGLSFCFKSNNWNIGAEGQLTFGAIVSGGVALLFYESGRFLHSSNSNTSWCNWWYALCINTLQS